MATGGWGGSVRVYEEDDKVDEKLLNQLSKWILYNRLPWLARNLGFTQAEIVRIMVPFNTPEEQIFQVNFSATPLALMNSYIFLKLNHFKSLYQVLKSFWESTITQKIMNGRKPMFPILLVIHKCRINVLKVTEEVMEFLFFVYISSLSVLFYEL